MRALITLGFLFLVVMSALFLFSIGLLPPPSPSLGALVMLVWTVLMSPFLGALAVVWIQDERPRFLPSDIFSSHKNYRSWSSREGWPQAPHLWYECGLCHKSLPSQSSYPRKCSCGNLFVGPDHIGAQNPSKVMLFEEGQVVNEHG